MAIKKYSPPKGFYDLRDFNIPSKMIFDKLAKIQRVLSLVNKQWMKYTKSQRNANRDSHSKWQNLSGEYQQILFSYGEKAQCKLEL